MIFWPEWPIRPKNFFSGQKIPGIPPTINSFVIEAIVVEESTFKLCKRQKCKFGLSPLGISKVTSGQLFPGMSRKTTLNKIIKNHDFFGFCKPNVFQKLCIL